MRKKRIDFCSNQVQLNIIEGDNSSHGETEQKYNFFKIMDAVEQYETESTWDPLVMSAVVFNMVLKSSNPVSVFELQYGQK